MVVICIMYYLLRNNADVGQRYNACATMRGVASVSVMAVVRTWRLVGRPKGF
jgi:hypothetical protein